MLVRPDVLAAILAMAVATYLTRAGGYWFGSRLRPGGATGRAMEALPGAVLVSVVVPAVVTGGLADCLAFAVAVLVAKRLPMLATIAVAAVAAAGFRYLLG